MTDALLCSVCQVAAQIFDGVLGQFLTIDFVQMPKLGGLQLNISEFAEHLKTNSHPILPLRG